MKIGYTEIKHPLVQLVNGDSMSVWWDDDGDINYFDYCPENYPAFTLGHFDNFGEAIIRLSEMLTEGWSVVENNLTKKI